MITSTLTFKAQTLYVAYAPEFNASAYGGCRDEALNNLTDEIRQRKDAGDATGEERT
jgi:hypothetical protein